MDVTLYVAKNDGNVLLSCKTTLMLGLIQPKTRLHYPKLKTSKDQILCVYPDVFEGIGNFPGPAYHTQINPSITFNQTPCSPIPVHLKEAFKQEIHKMLQFAWTQPISTRQLQESPTTSEHLKI